jgi:hypothetical protein
MAGDRDVIGWRLDSADREALLTRFPPSWPNVVAEHVTLASGVGADAPLPSANSGEVVGEVDDGAGLQALVVEIGGTTERPDGGTYHITWSLDRTRGREPKQSNEVLAQRGWQSLAPSIPVRLIPSRF